MLHNIITVFKNLKRQFNTHITVDRSDCKILKEILILLSVIVPIQVRII